MMAWRRHHGGGSWNSGFTLVELMVVIVVLAVVAATVLPQFSGTRQTLLLQDCGRRIAASIQLARSQAITQGRRIRWRLNTSEKRYWLEAESDNVTGPGFETLESIPGWKGEIPPTVNAQVMEDRAGDGGESGAREAPPQANQGRPAAGGGRGLAEIVFEPDGTTERRQVVLHDTDGFALALRLNPLTSRLRVLDLGRQPRGSSR